LTDQLVKSPNGGLMTQDSAPARVAEVHRVTHETDVYVRWDLDGRGEYEIETGVGFLDHMLAALARHGKFDLVIRATGDLHIDEHHTVEDVGIVLGQALDQALGERRGIRRFGDARVPMDDALGDVAIDLGGRGTGYLDLAFIAPSVGGVGAQMFPHFFRALASAARMTLHASIVRGENDHHRIESVFKAFARALDNATLIDQRIAGELPTTKGSI
jgi:imidazoleglycerol-phosphate dehydratase